MNEGDDAAGEGGGYRLTRPCAPGMARSSLQGRIHGVSRQAIPASIHAPRHGALGLAGGALDVPEGPWIGRALRETRRNVFARTIRPMDALTFAQRLAMKYLND